MDIWKLLLQRYPANEYAVLQEVRNAAGFGASRSADGIVINLWPSRGMHITGLECKASRSDWLRELKYPEKAEAVFKYCDKWYLVTENESIAKLEEIPVSWGWMHANEKGTKMVIKKEAPLLKCEAVSRDFLIAMMKRATQGMIHKSQMQDEIERVAEARAELKRDTNKRELEYAKADLEKIRTTIKAFEEISGVRVSSSNWNLKNIGAAVRMITDFGLQDIKKKFEIARDQYQKHADDLTKTINAL